MSIEIITAKVMLIFSLCVFLAGGHRKSTAMIMVGGLMMLFTGLWIFALRQSPKTTGVYTKQEENGKVY